MTRYSLALIPVALLAMIFGLGRLADKARVVEPAGSHLIVNGEALKTTNGYATAPIEGGFVAAQANFAEDLGAPSLRWGDQIKGVYLNVSELRPEFRLSLAGTGVFEVEVNGRLFALVVREGGAELKAKP